jgi:hypothetical protein
MRYVRLTASPSLMSVVVRRNLIRPFDQFNIGLGMKLLQRSQHRFKFWVLHATAWGKPGEACA